jgi:hypothetical protein
MSEEQKNVGLWIVALLIVLPAMYLASFGPACWLDSRDMLPLMIESAYIPLRQFSNDGPEPLRSALSWYARVGSKEVELIPVTELVGAGCQMPFAICPPSTADEP